MNSSNEEEEEEEEEEDAFWTSIKYRLSCVRAESSAYQFSRQELLGRMAPVFLPSSRNDCLSRDRQPNRIYHELHCHKWKVDLNRYHMELVLFLRPHCWVMGISLKPYSFLGLRGFAPGLALPTDVSPPLYGAPPLGLGGRTTPAAPATTLRPANAQILLHLARLQPGEIVLDPCAGIGTIPIETQFQMSKFHTLSPPPLPAPPVLALGGDVVLTPSPFGLGSWASAYQKQSQKYQKQSVARNLTLSTTPAAVDLFAWDACQLPFRDAFVDVVVTDLPFGKLCLSAAKLNQILPLLMNEMARVLCPGTGRMVLLCGAYTAILETLEQANENSQVTKISTTKIDENNQGEKQQEQHIWNLPCQAVFPVNIGGLLAWIIQVERGLGTIRPIENKTARLLKLVQRRDQVRRREEAVEQQRKARKCTVNEVLPSPANRKTTSNLSKEV